MSSFQFFFSLEFVSFAVKNKEKKLLAPVVHRSLQAFYFISML